MTQSGEMLSAYMNQLTPLEQKVLRIAASHLETSFSLVKSIGFQEWQAQAAKEQAAKEQEQAAKEQAPQQQAPQQPPVKKIIRIKLKLTPL